MSAVKLSGAIQEGVSRLLKVGESSNATSRYTT
jgi:hypothetical protein